MTARAVAFLVAACLAEGQPVESSGCFGGDPDIVPRHGARGLPVNTQVRIARRSPAAVAWTDARGTPVPMREQRIGVGPAAARVLIPAIPLSAGLHTVRTSDPDVTVSFEIGAGTDVQPPRLHGPLALASQHAPEPGGSCPENTWIRASFTAPDDDRTPPDAFSYLVGLEGVRPATSGRVEVLAHAEAIERGTVRLRVGETGCGCIPRARLDPAVRYRVTIQAFDLGGHRSRDTLSGEVAFKPSRQARAIPLAAHRGFALQKP